MNNQLKQQVTQRITYLSDLIEQSLGHIIALPRIKYIGRGTNAGMANSLSWTLTFNSVLLADNQNDFIEHTVAHEYAHLITDHLHGIQQFPHGNKWQKIMKVFNVPATVTHQYDISKLIDQTRVWLCACQSHYVSLHVAKQLQSGNRYACPHCGVPVHQ